MFTVGVEILTSYQSDPRLHLSDPFEGVGLVFQSKTDASNAILTSTPFFVWRK